MSNTPKVAIVILNWNGKNYLEKFLPSVVSSVAEPHKIYIVDNMSTDKSVEFLITHYPQIEIIQVASNLGFAGGYNFGLKQIDAEYYFLLNLDVEVTPNWLEPLLSLMEQDKTIAVCQPKILSYNNKQKFEYAGAAGGWIDFLGYPFCRGRIFDNTEFDNLQYENLEEIFWASGAAFFIRSHLFHQHNGFDEYFFSHQEEIDLCWRLKQAGHKIFTCPTSVVYHVGGGTLPQGATLKTFLNFRNNLILLSKNLSLGEKLWKIPFRILLDFVAGHKALFQGDVGFYFSIFKSHLAWLYWLMVAKKIKQKNKPIKNFQGVYHRMIVWDYFIKKKKYFSQLFE